MSCWQESYWQKWQAATRFAELKNILFCLQPIDQETRISAQLENTSLNQTFMDYNLYLSQLRKSPKENSSQEEGMGSTHTDCYRRKMENNFRIMTKGGRFQDGTHVQEDVVTEESKCPC